MDLWLFNQSYEGQIIPLVIYGLGIHTHTHTHAHAHTHTRTHTHTHTHTSAQSDFRNQVCASLKPAFTRFKNQKGSFLCYMTSNHLRPRPHLLSVNYNILLDHFNIMMSCDVFSISCRKEYPGDKNQWCPNCRTKKGGCRFLRAKV